MTLGLLFWIVMLVWFLLAFPWPWTSYVPGPVSSIVLFILFLVIGRRLFGPPIHG